MRTTHYYIIALLIFISVSVSAKVRLPHILCDDMVLQQNSDVRLWGWAKPGSTVSITASWLSEPVKALTGKDGRWLAMVHTPAASFTPLSLSFADGDGPAVSVSNILAGEVWVCAGQSNMEFPVKGFTHCPMEGYNETVLGAKDVHGIRYVKIPSVMKASPQDDADCKWTEVNMATVNNCSAVGYFFARTLSHAIDEPVGLIMANKGGTRVESWLDEANLRKYTNEELDLVKMIPLFKYDYMRPLLWGNGTFHPILNYTVKGILFYQGCSNVGDPGNQYSDRLKLLVEQWRRDFREPDMPFYFVQIAPFAQGGSKEGTQRALMYEQQVRANDIIPNSGIVCINDLVYPYEYSQIHPSQKRQIGERLAFLALKRNYGMDKLIAESPRFKSMDIEGSRCFLTFDHMDGGYSRVCDMTGFEVAGADSVFHTATGRYYWGGDGNPHNRSILVESDEVKHPVAVRYCFRNFQVGNVKNGGGLPLLPFRTDNW